jgi:hypothetical protein
MIPKATIWWLAGSQTHLRTCSHAPARLKVTCVNLDIHGATTNSVHVQSRHVYPCWCMLGQGSDDDSTRSLGHGAVGEIQIKRRLGILQRQLLARFAGAYPCPLSTHVLAYYLSSTY